MSRHNHDRRLKHRCLKCGCPFPNLEAAIRAAEPVLAALARPRSRQQLHVCGACRAYHVLENGALRRLTPAEEFDLRMRHPESCERVDSEPPKTDGSVDLFVE